MKTSRIEDFFGYNLSKEEVDGIAGIFQEYKLGELTKKNIENYFSIVPVGFDISKKNRPHFVFGFELPDSKLDKFSNYILNLNSLETLNLNYNRIEEIPDELRLLPHLASFEISQNPLSTKSLKVIYYLKLRGTNIF